MITFIAHLRVHPDNARAFEDLMTYVTDMTLKNEPGVAYYGFAKSAADADTYVVLEVYRDRAAFIAHGQTPWVRESVPKSLLLTEGMPRLVQYVSPGVEPVVSRFKDTAETSVATVRRFMAASGAEGREERRSLLHDDLVVREAGGLPFSGDYHGPQGFFDLLNTMNDLLEVTVGPITTDPLGSDTVAARFQLTFTSRASGSSVEMGLVEIYTVRDGRIAELDVYYKDPGAVAALLAT